MSIGVSSTSIGPSSATARLVETRVDGQAVEPGIEPLGVTQPRQVAPGSDERLLDRVAGQLRVPEDEAGGLVQPRDGPAGEFGEGVMIAPPRSLDESTLVHGRLGIGTAWRSCSLAYGVGVAVSVLADSWRPRPVARGLGAAGYPGRD